MSIQHKKLKGNLQLEFHNFYIPQLERHRDIRVLLPSDYFSATDRRFPVIYMQDGQNLFEPETSFGGRDWQIPRTMARLPKKYQAIIVGIDNGGVDRMDEYAPILRGHHGGQGERYVKFIFETLKPFIDGHYRTLPQREMTGIAGSSMGGLISFYAGLQFGHIFGKVGVLSPSLWFNPQLLHTAEQHSGEKSQFYVLGSKLESRTMDKHLHQIFDAMRKGGFSEHHNLRVTVRDKGRHNEVFWGREFEKMIRYFFD